MTMLHKFKTTLDMYISRDAVPEEADIVALIRLSENEWKILAHGKCDDTGTVQIPVELQSSIYPNYPVYVVAILPWGTDFTENMAVVAGDYIRPTNFGGWVFKCLTGGVMPSEEPDWEPIIKSNSDWNIGDVSLRAFKHYQPIAHGPVSNVDWEETEFDPHWDKVVALLHFEEGLTDEKGGSWEVYLSGFIDNGFSRFGSGSLSTTARGGAVGGTEQVDTTDSFTLEGWVYITDLAPLNIIYSSRHRGADKRSSSLHVSGGTLGFQIFSSAGALQQSIGAAFSALEWTHVAVTYEKSTNLLRLFQNGVKTCEEPVSSGWVAQNPRYLAAWPNTDQPTRYLRGHLDEWRETVGVARYTENFDPPTAPFPNIGPLE